MINIYSQIVDENRWEDFNIEDLTLVLSELITEYCVVNNDREVSVVFTNNDTVHNLNNLYRGKDSPTNVLSFAFNDDGSDNEMLGELFLAYDVIKEEAEAQKKDFSHHLTHILMHGILHLLGYDHIEDEDAEEMENIEIELLSKINIENPYKV